MEFVKRVVAITTQIMFIDVQQSLENIWKCITEHSFLHCKFHKINLYKGARRPDGRRLCGNRTKSPSEKCTPLYTRKRLFSERLAFLWPSLFSFITRNPKAKKNPKFRHIGCLQSEFIALLLQFFSSLFLILIFSFHFLILNNSFSWQ